MGHQVEFPIAGNVPHLRAAVSFEKANPAIGLSCGYGLPQEVFQ
jgi:hypothetical protein